MHDTAASDQRDAHSLPLSVSAQRNGQAVRVPEVALDRRSRGAARRSPLQQSFLGDWLRLAYRWPTARAHRAGPVPSQGTRVLNWRLTPALELVGGCGGRASKQDGGDDHTAAPRAPNTACRKANTAAPVLRRYAHPAARLNQPSSRPHDRKRRAMTPQRVPPRRNVVALTMETR